MKTLHFTGREVGLVYSATGIAAIFMPWILGVVADKYLELQKLLAGLHFTGGILMIILMSQSTFVTFFPVVLAYSFCYQPTFALTSSLCFHHLPNGTEDYPKVRVFGTIGWILGGLVISIFGWERENLSMLISAIASFVLSFYCLTLPKTMPLGKNERKTQIFEFLKNREMIIIFIAVLLITIPSSFYYSFVNTYLNDMKIAYPAAKMSIGQISEILVMMALPFFLRKVNWVKTLAIGFFIWGARYLIFVVSGGSEPMIWLGLALHGFAYCFGILTAQMYVNEAAKPSIRSTAQGVFSFVVMGIGTTLGSMIAGWTVQSAQTTNGVDWAQVWKVSGWIGVLTCMGFLISSRLLVKINKT
jgi:nucleoside transporter